MDDYIIKLFNLVEVVVCICVILCCFEMVKLGCVIKVGKFEIDI